MTMGPSLESNRPFVRWVTGLYDEQNWIATHGSIEVQATKKIILEAFLPEGMKN